MIDPQLRQYLKKATIVFFGTFIAAFAGFITQIILARNLSVVEYGIFNTQITLLNFLSPCIGLGLSAYWLKIYGENQESAKEWMPVSLKLILVTSILIAIFIIVNALIVESLSFWILLVLIFYCFGQSVVELVGSKFQTEYDYNNFTFSQATPHIIRLILVIGLVLLNQQNLNNFILVYSTVGLIIILFWGPKLYSFLLQKPKKSKLVKKNLLELTYNTFPFWMAGFLYLTYMQSSILILSYISGPEKTGYYSSAFVILSAIYLLPSVLYQKLLLPKLHNWAYHDKGKLLKIYALGNKLMIVLGLIFSLFLYLSSESIVLTLYGENYRQTIDVLKILCLAIPFKFISSSVGAFLSTRGFMSSKVRVMIIVSIFNVMMSFILISFYSLKGAIIVSVLTEIIMMALLLNIFHSKYKRNLNED
ncbi:oligosaccharide flippase family protein [Acinetobacter haemolyticus]|uniref:oligosaccharide flippase family protein n=1 Tax=Acinetobacter haemolyticus TaxID=29430 RepID=UPI0012987916|nr:oligosaccharide flippase family protein [Acinetobacter haemolyticus]MQZ32253.1 oligosaccharide flippase family protein [Acinetobacter haemolyticus]